MKRAYFQTESIAHAFCKACESVGRRAMVGSYTSGGWCVLWLAV